ncbi:hypothetical protein BIV24_14950 [Streptomyces colonosanans]|uniref:Uncharacterized protein n=1 Tax=Streptomyces colonosanans TaxID=1428652 RepID=A0A1S2PDY7_9ACTN|nr:hypothetical protein BIV24_14950 [Streptomyces colonosanans]
MEAGAQAARSRALAVLRVRSRALAVALLPAAVAVVLFVGGSTGHISGAHWATVRWIVAAVAAVVLLSAAGVALVVARARPAISPTVPIAEDTAPDLYRMVRDLADRLDVPAPSAIALTPDCDSWLEDRAHPAHNPPPSASAHEIPGVRGIRGLSAPRHHHAPTAPVLVIGSPFLWWMRVGELRAVLAPVVAGTGPSAHPDIAAARRFVRGLDAAVAVTSAPAHGPLTRMVLAGVGWVTRLLLRSCRGHAAEMERGVAAAAAEHAQAVDYGLRIVAQEQVGLAYAGWDRLLTRVALPAWRMGRWPSRLDAGVVAALTELSRRDRLAEAFASRLGERPACDLLEEPGVVDEAASLLAARLFHGGPARPGRNWAPVDWQEYPDEVVDRTWRMDAARLYRVLDALGVHHVTDTTTPDADGPTLDRVLEYLTVRVDGGEGGKGPGTARVRGAGWAEQAGQVQRRGRTEPVGPNERAERASGGAAIPETAGTPGDEGASDGPRGLAGEGAPEGVQAPGAGRRADGDRAPGGEREPDSLRAPRDDNASGEKALHSAAEASAPGDVPPGDTTTSDDGGTPQEATTPHDGGAEGETAAPDAGGATSDACVLDGDGGRADVFPPDDEGLVASGRTAALLAGLSAAVAREEAGAGAIPSGGGAGQPAGPDRALWDDGTLPLFPLQPPRTGRELLVDHVTAMVCCAAMDTAGAAPGLDWLDGPSLLVKGERMVDLAPRVLTLVEEGDPVPLRTWLVHLGIRPEKPVRLV